MGVGGSLPEFPNQTHCVHLEVGSLAQSQGQPAATRVSWAEMRLCRTEQRPRHRHVLTGGEALLWGTPLANGSTVMISLLLPLPAEVTATTQTLY